MIYSSVKGLTYYTILTTHKTPKKCLVLLALNFLKGGFATFFVSLTV